MMAARTRKPTAKPIVPSDPVARSPDLKLDPALALLEFTSIAAGVQAGDAMVKRAVLETIRMGTVQPGHWLILVGGTVAEVDEALKAGREAAPDALLDHIFLPGVDQRVVKGLAGTRSSQLVDALGIIETNSVPSALHAADIGMKGAQIELLEIRLADGLHGKGLVFFTGSVSDMEAGIDLIRTAIPAHSIVRTAVIPQLHADIRDQLLQASQFAAHLGWQPR
jgi:microcompartment protein CcmL/EutN